MSKLDIILVAIIVFVFAIAGVNAYLGYSGYDSHAQHYMTEGKWSDQTCAGCHYNVHTETEMSYHVQTDVTSWSPLTNTNFEVDGEQRWIENVGINHPGGGPLADFGVDIDCLICHDQTGQYDFNKRSDALISGDYEIANEKAFKEARSNLEQSPFYIASYVADVLTPLPVIIAVHDPIYGGPSNQNCAQTCHLQEAKTTAVTWAEDAHSSYDVHGDMNCLDCHITDNHEIGSSRQDTTPPGHEELSNQMPTCTASGCHEGISHGPMADAHLEFMTCTSCHVPKLAGADRMDNSYPLESFSWKDGERKETIRESDTTPMIGWYKPTEGDDRLPMPYSKEDEDVRMAPFNVITGTWWDKGIDDDIVQNPNTSTSVGNPIPISHVEQADIDGDGTVTEEEIRSVDISGDGEPDYPNAILRTVELYYPIYHNIAGSKAGLDDPLSCDGCHGVSGSEFLQEAHFPVNDEKPDDCISCHVERPAMDWAFLGYQEDPAETDPPTNWSDEDVSMTLPRQPPGQVEREPVLRSVLFEQNRGNG